MSFIVIEGLDGSGKSTQLKLLKKYLAEQHITYHFLHFPRTDDGIFGDLVARFLRGDLGRIDEVNPYLVGLIYAGDREHSKETINQWIAAGDLVIVDRYVHSNMAFQGAKLSNQQEKLNLRKWLNELEYNYYGIPRPDMSLFLDVPFSFTTKSLSNHRLGDDRGYLEGKQDIHEADLSFQEKVRQEYLDLVATDSTFELIACYNSQLQMLEPDTIFQLIITILKTKQLL
ncbi:MAG: dTMP kinase [Salinivirgaceae bacterium]|jgi:dTMP kinase